jgi:protein involved in polysaccharide export with SLBB domain
MVFYRQVPMKPISSLIIQRLRILSMLFVSALLLLPVIGNAQATPSTSELQSGITPQQAEAIRQAIQFGKPIPPEIVKELESRPELKEKLPPDLREKMEALEKKEDKEGKEAKEVKEGEGPEVAKKPAAPLPPEAPAILPPYDWKTSVYVGGLFAKRLHDNEIKTLTHFGHEVFAPRAGGVPILENIPVTPDYIVGPGDEVIVKLWGRMEGTHRMTVDREGKIFLPKLGSLYVAGKTFGELRSFLRSRISSMAEVSSDVSLGQMKGIRVSVVGEVRSPGWYNVSSLHTALQAILLAGGVKDIGSLRRIGLHRGGKAVETIDLYDFLLKGDTRADTRLVQGDTIFVPVVGKLTAISGEVRRPAIYELQEEKKLLDLVGMAGGFAPSAYKKRIQVERLEGHTAKIVLDADAEELEQEKGTFELADGDIVRVLPIVYEDINAVTLEGNVYRPGKYELKHGMTVGSLFKDEKDFLPETYFDYALLTRLVPPDLHKEAIPVNLREIVLEKKKEADVALLPRDTLKVFPRSAFRDTHKVTVSGEVREPGSFDLKKGSRLTDLLKQAGDLTRFAYTPQAEVVRADEKNNFRTIYVNLEKALAGDQEHDIPLEDQDQVIIRQMPGLAEKIQVSALGEVRFPGYYTMRRGERLSTLIERAGGYTSDAYLKAGQFTRVSTQKTQQEAIDRLIEELELEVAQKAQVGTVLDKEDIEANKELLAARRSLISQLRKARAKGRVVIRLSEFEKLRGSSADILLEDGDRLEIPKKQNVVNVVGRVYNPTGVVYDPANDRLGYYLRTVGGPTESADREHIFMIKADGSVVTRENAEGGFFVFGEKGLMSARVEPGDSIVVPEKLIQTRLMKDIKDITQILYQIAVTAGVLIVAF